MRQFNFITDEMLIHMIKLINEQQSIVSSNLQTHSYSLNHLALTASAHVLVDDELLDTKLNTLSPDEVNLLGVGGDIIGLPVDGNVVGTKERVVLDRCSGITGVGEGLTDSGELAVTAGVGALAGRVTVNHGDSSKTVEHLGGEGRSLLTTIVLEHVLTIQQVTGLVDAEDLASVKTVAEGLAGSVEDSLHVVPVARLAHLNGDGEDEGSIGGSGGNTIPEVRVAGIDSVDAVIGEGPGEEETGFVVDGKEDTVTETEVVHLSDLLGEGVLITTENLSGTLVLEDEVTIAGHKGRSVSKDGKLEVVQLTDGGRWDPLGEDAGVNETTMAVKGEGTIISYERTEGEVRPVLSVAAQHWLGMVEVHLLEVVLVATTTTISAVERGLRATAAGLLSLGLGIISLGADDSSDESNNRQEFHVG